jgi:hypothetical protein
MNETSDQVMQSTAPPRYVFMSKLSAGGRTREELAVSPSE